MPYRLESEVYWVEDYTVNEGYKWGLTKEDYWQLYTPNYKIQDKHKRRINLFLRTCLRRIIDPTLTPEDALICLYWDREKIIDNSDGVVDNKQLMKSVSKAFKLSDDELEQITQSEIEFLKANKKTPQIIYKAKPREEWSKDNRKDKTKFTPLLKDPVGHPWQLGKLIYPKPLEHPDTMRKCFLMHIIDKCFDKSLSDSDNIDRINNIMAMNKFRLRVSSRQTIASYKAAYKIEKNKDRNSFIIQEYLKGSSSYQIKDEIDLHPEFNKVSARQIQRIIKEYNKNLSTSSSTTN